MVKVTIDTDKDDLPDTVLLGHVVMYEIVNGDIRREDIVDSVETLGMTGVRVPPETRAVDAFKTAISGLKRTYQGVGNVPVTLGSESITTPTDVVKRIIVRRSQDRRRQVTHTNAIECTFYRQKLGPDGRVVVGSERVNFVISSEVPAAERPIMEAVCAELEAAYVKARNVVSGPKVRMMVREYLKALNAIDLKDGVYFVRTDRGEQLTALTSLVNNLDGCTMLTLPLLDLPQERRTLSRQFSITIRNRLHEVERNATELLDTRQTITQEAYDKVRGHYEVALQQANEYLELLGIDQKDIHEAGETALVALTSLHKKLMEDS